MNYSIPGGLSIDMGFQVHSIFQLPCRQGPCSVAQKTSSHEICNECSTQLILWGQGEEDKKAAIIPFLSLLPSPAPSSWWNLLLYALSLLCLARIAKPLGRVKVAFTLLRPFSITVLKSLTWHPSTECCTWRVNELVKYQEAGSYKLRENEQSMWNKPRGVNKRAWLRFAAVNSHTSHLSVAIPVT